MFTFSTAGRIDDGACMDNLAGGKGYAGDLVALAADCGDRILDIVNARLDRLLDQPFNHQRGIVIPLVNCVQAARFDVVQLLERVGIGNFLRCDHPSTCATFFLYTLISLQNLG